MEKVNISTQLLNAVLNYLAQKPFHEVVSLINALQQEASSQVDASQEKKPE